MVHITLSGRNSTFTVGNNRLRINNNTWCPESALHGDDKPARGRFLFYLSTLGGRAFWSKNGHWRRMRSVEENRRKVVHFRNQPAEFDRKLRSAQQWGRAQASLYTAKFSILAPTIRVAIKTLSCSQPMESRDRAVGWRWKMRSAVCAILFGSRGLAEREKLPRISNVFIWERDCCCWQVSLLFYVLLFWSLYCWAIVNYYFLLDWKSRKRVEESIDFGRRK